jgi:starvation-inducible DNA-binding protein
MENLLAALRMLMANNIALKFKAHGYHWNVESDDFKQFHEFFQEIYENYDEATDEYAEFLRMMRAYAPYRLVDFFDLMNVGEPVIVGDPEPMVQDLYNTIEMHIQELVAVSDMANAAKQYGLSNFLAERMTDSQKFCWQLRASMEEPETEMED